MSYTYYKYQGGGVEICKISANDTKTHSFRNMEIVYTLLKNTGAFETNEAFEPKTYWKAIDINEVQ